MTQPTQPTQPTSNELPRELPGREPDDALGAAALDDVRAQIAARVVDTQGAWAAKPAWQRAAPLALATTCAVAWSAWCVSHSSGPSMAGDGATGIGGGGPDGVVNRSTSGTTMPPRRPAAKPRQSKPEPVRVTSPEP